MVSPSGYFFLFGVSPPPDSPVACTHPQQVIIRHVQDLELLESPHLDGEGRELVAPEVELLEIFQVADLGRERADALRPPAGPARPAVPVLDEPLKRAERRRDVARQLVAKIEAVNARRVKNLCFVRRPARRDGAAVDQEEVPFVDVPGRLAVAGHGKVGGLLRGKGVEVEQLPYGDAHTGVPLRAGKARVAGRGLAFLGHREVRPAERAQGADLARRVTERTLLDTAGLAPRLRVLHLGVCERAEVLRHVGVRTESFEPSAGAGARQVRSV